jgi:hypothetical protein
MGGEKSIRSLRWRDELCATAVRSQRRDAADRAAVDPDPLSGGASSRAEAE